MEMNIYSIINLSLDMVWTGWSLFSVWLQALTSQPNLAQFACKFCTSNNHLYLLARKDLLLHLTILKEVIKSMCKKRNWQALFSPSADSTREFYALISTDLRPYQNRICRITHWKWMYLYFHYIKLPYFRKDIEDTQVNLNTLKGKR